MALEAAAAEPAPATTNATAQTAPMNSSSSSQRRTSNENAGAETVAIVPRSERHQAEVTAIHRALAEGQPLVNTLTYGFRPGWTELPLPELRVVHTDQL